VRSIWLFGCPDVSVRGAEAAQGSVLQGWSDKILCGRPGTNGRGDHINHFLTIIELQDNFLASKGQQWYGRSSLLFVPIMKRHYIIWQARVIMVARIPHDDFVTIIELQDN